MSEVESDNANTKLPRHIAIIMDGNGRWAKQRSLPRFAGHRAGVEAVREVVKTCAAKGVEALTLFAFSSENWRRPQKEVGLLMELLFTALNIEVKKLHKNNVQLSFIGDRSRFDEKMRAQLEKSEQLTANNTGLKLIVAVNYGGKWDLTHAMKKIAAQVKSGELDIEDINSDTIDQALSLYGLPSPDLFIRTGGEKRISNFLLWQLAYTELYFTDVLWPDFDAAALESAIASFCSRERRFGQTSEQVKQCTHA